MKKLIRQYSLEISLSFFTLILCIWFYSPGSWNQSARDDMTYTIVENGTFQIDRFLPYPKQCFNTGDWAMYGGHYYSNKAPGSSFVGAAAYAPLYYFEKLLHPERSKILEIFNAKWITVWNSAVPTAIAVFLIIFILQALGCSRARALFFAACFGLGTMMWPYSTMNWGHPLAASFLVFALYCLLKGSMRNTILCGFWCGCAVLTDYGAFLALPFFGGYLFLRKKTELIYFTAGGLLPAVLFAWYHNHCFGSPFTLASSCSNPVFLESDKAGGLFGKIAWLVPLRLLIGVQRGIFPISPILLLVFPGGVQLWRTGKKAIVLLCGGWILSGLFANASFNGWHGGDCVGPRYLIYTLPAWIVLASAFRWRENLGRLMALLLAAVSFLNMICISIFTANIQGNTANPLYLLLWKRLLDGSPFDCSGMGIRLHGIEKDALLWLERSNLSFGHLAGAPRLDFFLITALSLIVLWFVLKHPIFSPYLTGFLKDWKVFQSKNYTFSLSSLNYWIVAGIVLLLLFPGNAKWVNTEPLLVGNAIEHNLASSCGTIPVLFYQILLFFTFDPVTLVFLKIIFTGAFNCFCLWKIAEKTAWSPSILIALYLLNPWTWYYTRLIGDHVLLLSFLLFSLWMILEFSAKGRLYHFLGCATGCVLAVSTHISALPMALVFCIWSILLLKRNWRQILPVGIPAVLLILLSLFLRFQAIGRSLKGLKGSLFQFFEFAFLPGISAEIFPKCGSVISFAIVITLLMIASIHLLRSRNERWSFSKQVIVFSIAVLLADFLFILFVPACSSIHSIVIFPLLFLAASTVQTYPESKLCRWGLCIWLLLGTCWIIFFTVQIDITGGTRNEQYGITLGNQWKIAQTIVLRSRKYQVVDINSQGTLYRTYPHALDVLSSLAEAENTDKKNVKEELMDTISFEYEGNSSFLKMKDHLSPVPPSLKNKPHH